MDYMDVSWPVFANTPFCTNYVNININNMANESIISHLREKIDQMDAMTFRALVKRKKTTRFLLEKFQSINQTNSTVSISITDAVSLPIEICGNRDVLVILRIIQGTLDNSANAELFVFSTVQDVPIVWNDNLLFTRLRTLIRQTLKVYEEQQALNDQAMAVNSSIVELLRSFPSSQTNDQNRETGENLDISLEFESISESGDLNYSEEPQDISSPHILYRESNGETELKFTTTEKGKPCILENGYTYTKHRVYNGTFQWHCVERKSCRARIHTNGTSILKKTNEHTHEPNSKIFHCNEVKAGLKRKAADTQEPTHSIVASEISKLGEESAVYLPRLDSLKRSICRSRRRAENVPSEPTSLQTLQIPEAYTKTNKGEPFLLYDSGSIAENSRIIIFGTKCNVETLNTSSVWLADGTFKVAPKLFFQLYVVHALKGGPDTFENGHMLPSLFVLLPSKSENIYRKMWSKIKDLCPTACPSHIIVDFEMASINAFRKYFPHTTIKGCFFHLTQNIWRKVQELGLQSRYNQDPLFALQIRMLAALAFATPTDIPELFSEIFMQLPMEAYDLAAYFEATYVGRHISSSNVVPSMFPIEMWNNHHLVHQGIPRTTNSVEAWHRSFNHLMSCQHPSIWKFIEILKKEQGLVEIKHAFYLSGRKPTKRKKYTDQENALRNLIDSYLSRPKLEFLKGVAFRFEFST